MTRPALLPGDSKQGERCATCWHPRADHEATFCLGEDGVPCACNSFAPDENTDELTGRERMGLAEWGIRT